MKSLTFALLMLLIGCNNSTNNVSKTHSNLSSNQTSICSKSIRIDTLSQNIMPLDYAKFDTLSIKNLFKESYVFHITKTYPEDNSFICSLKTKNSEVIISSQGYNLPYYLDYAKITDNSIHLNYSIEIGMNRDSFFKNIRQPVLRCDSIKVSEIGSTSLFVFENNKLKEIIITTTI